MTVIYAVVLGAISVVPLPERLDTAVGRLDKLAHLCEYLLLAWCLVQAAGASGYPRTKIPVIALLFPVSFGILLEGVQSLLPYRSAEWWDVAADALGAGLGVWIGLIEKRHAAPRERLVR